MTTLSLTTSAQAQQATGLEYSAQGSSSVTQIPQEPEPVTPAVKQSFPQPEEAVKVGRIQSEIETATEQAETIAKIHAFELAGRQAVVLYVRNIPVLTFLSTPSPGIEGTQTEDTSTRSRKRASNNQHLQARAYNADTLDGDRQRNAALEELELETNPVWKATTVAARLNQMHRDNVDARNIVVRWNAEDKAYSIEVNGEEIAQVNNTTILPDTTRNLAQDALQATNRMRRLVGNAPPLRKIADMPQPEKPPVRQVALGPIRMEIRGMASWYGPGFHGNRSASGEIYNQNALTAAHRNLPFGTNVLVTNLRNGRSVVVRINDRGPFVRGRVIDLSAAAARMLGMMQSGVAPVSVQVIDNSRVASDSY
jgi:rare lipoprotein A